MSDNEEATPKTESKKKPGGIHAVLGVLSVVGGVIWGLAGFNLTQEAAREVRFFMAGIVVFAGLVLYALGEILCDIRRIAERDGG